MLVSEKHKKLVLNLRHPERVTTVIPTAKMLTHQGQSLVVVPHRNDEVRVLRNLGIDAPAPISSYYEWQGKYQPFMHQRSTAEFLTMNPRSFCHNGMGCIAGDDKVRVRRYGKSQELPLRELFKKYHALPDKAAWECRSLMDGRFGLNTLEDVLYKGEKRTLRITLEDGKTFRATPDHRIARPDGSWTEAGDLAVGDDLVTNGVTELACSSCGTLRKLKHASKRSAGQMCRACHGAKHSLRMWGSDNPAWAGGSLIDKDGYRRVRMPRHARANPAGYVYEHIVVAEAAFSIQVTTAHHVHHINGIKDDNRPENLEVLTAGDHHRKHEHYANLDGSVSGKGGVVVVLPKKGRISSIEDGGVVDVYDLSMAAPHHNFVVNGIVVHNSGKTLSVLWSFDFLRQEKQVRRMLVIAPLSTLERTWADEIFGSFPEMTYCTLHGTKERRLKLLKLDYDVYIINHDGLKTKEVMKALKERDDIDLIVVDEIASFRNAGTDRFKALNNLIDKRPWVWGLTGTPTPNAPTDAWAQAKLISPGNVPKSFMAFREAVMKPSGPFKWLPRDTATKSVQAALQPAIRFAREDCIDLPPTTYTTREVAMTPEQSVMYKDMLNKMKADHAAGSVLAVNEAVKMGKLLQIACGAVYDAEHEVITVPSKPRIDALKEFIEESGSKVIVFVPFTGALENLAAELAKDYTVAIIHGQTSKAQRDQIFGDFQKRPDPHVLVANPAAMSHGLTLTAASTIVWYAPTMSNEVYEQANARIVRPGQKLNTLIAHLEGCEAERKAYERLRTKGKMQGLLLDLLKGV